MTAKAQQAVDDSLHAARFMSEFIEALLRTFRANLRAEHVRVANDARERIVQFVRDARHELPESRELFRAYEFVVQLHIFECDGQVRREDFEPDHLRRVWTFRILRI